MRHDYWYNAPNDPEMDNALATFFAVLFWFAMIIAGIVYVMNRVTEWISVGVTWCTDMVMYVASFWPF